MVVDQVGEKFRDNAPHWTECFYWVCLYRVWRRPVDRPSSYAPVQILDKTDWSSLHSDRRRVSLATTWDDTKTKEKAKRKRKENTSRKLDSVFDGIKTRITKETEDPINKRSRERTKQRTSRGDVTNWIMRWTKKRTHRLVFSVATGDSSWWWSNARRIKRGPPSQLR